MSKEAELEAVRAVAYGLFSLDVEAGSDKADRHEKWLAERATHMTNARRLVRRLEAREYVINKVE